MFRQVISAMGDLKRLCPRAQLTVGLSNLSAAFGRLGKLREALHSTFLQHAVPKGAPGLGTGEVGKMGKDDEKCSIM
jgi:cobalamin-dependent methionine synthase I